MNQVAGLWWREGRGQLVLSIIKHCGLVGSTGQNTPGRFSSGYYFFNIVVMPCTPSIQCQGFFAEGEGGYKDDKTS